MALFGYIFWLTNAHLYSAADIGLAAALIAAINLIINLSQLGFNTAIIRKLPQSKNKNGMINGISIIIGIVSICLTAAFVLLVNVISPKLGFIYHTPLIIPVIICFGAISTLNVLTDNVFVAYRATGYTLTVNIIFCVVRLVLALFLVSQKANGLFLSFAVGITACMVFSYIALFRLGYKITAKPDFREIKSMARFSSGNYLSNIFNLLPTLLMPLIVTNRISPTKAGYFYMAFTIAQAIYTIPIAVTTALLAEGSHAPGKLKSLIKSAVFINFALMLPIILAVSIFAGPLLELFGHNYSLNGQGVLRLLALSSIFVLINYIFITFYRLMDRAVELALTQILGAAIIITLVNVFVHKGLIGVGWGWLAGQASLSILLGLRFAILLRSRNNKEISLPTVKT
jgi:O-antigen/teichoic acid export membrane protein